MALYKFGMFPGELQPNAVVGGCIHIFENVWPDPKTTIQRAEAECCKPESGVTWQKAATFDGGVMQDHRSNLNLNVTESGLVYNNPVMQNIHNQFNMLLLATTYVYADKAGLPQDTLYHETYNLLKYRENEEYKVHYDGGTGQPRTISCICYLNDDYEGGELEFPNFDIKIKPQAGMLILFPSSYPYKHVAHPVISGTKYNLVTWIRDEL